MTKCRVSGTSNLHFVYVTLILSLSIIGLITNDWTKLEGFTEYLNVAATVTALVLGLLAIIYAFVSTGSMSQLLGSIQGSTNAMNAIAGEMRETIIAGQHIQSRADKRTAELHLVADRLATGLLSLDESTKNLTGKVDSIPTQINELKESLALSGNMVPSPSISNINGSHWNSETIAKTLADGSSHGIVLLKGISVAKDRGLYLDTAKIGESNSYYYGYGYLIALQATGLLKLEYPTSDVDLNAVRLNSGPEDLKLLIDAEWEVRKADKTKSIYIIPNELMIEEALHDASDRLED